MRVTKTIKDYVTRMVEEIYSEPTEEEKSKVEDLLNQLNL